ncbi:MAG: hypothetical protein ABI183_27285 [Polyangiaceae bacterium]
MPRIAMFLVLGIVLLTTMDARATRLHLHGTAHLEAQIARDSGDVVIRGRATDDAGDPLGNEKIRARVERKSDAHGMPAASMGTVDCDPIVPHKLPLISDDLAELRADDAGRFCMRVAMPIDQYVVHFSIEATPLIDGTVLDLPLDLSARPLTLRFDPEPTEISLDDPLVTVEAHASIDDDNTAAPSSSIEGLLLTLASESGTPLGSSLTDAGGHARFHVDPKKFGAPGPGELRASYRGDAERTTADVVAKVMRRAKVHLLPIGPLAGGAPDDGISIPLNVTTGAGDPVASGSIEAQLGNVVVGAALVQAGHADLRVVFAAPATPSARIVIHYLPSAPWFDGSEPLDVDVPVHPPSAWKQIPLIIMAVAVALFLLLERMRRNPQRPTRPAMPIERRAEPDVHVVAEALAPGAGWAGRVIDAHERFPIARARVAIEHLSFGAPEILESVFTDAEGHFKFGHAPKTGTLSLSSVGWAHRGRTLVDLEARLVIDAPLHVSLRKKLPPSGEIEIALISRKRAILDRLVEWARMRGKPFDARPEPTPGHVQRAAGKAVDVAAWAEAIERAAFDDGDVDARVEQEIDAIAPKNDPLARPRS